MIKKLDKHLLREFHKCADRFWMMMNSETGSREENPYQDYFSGQKRMIEHYALELLKQKSNHTFATQVDFQTESLKTKVDIYEKDLTTGKTALYEVYSSKGFRTHQLWDLAFMAYVLKQSGEVLTKIFGVYLNTDYYKDEASIDPANLIIVKDLTYETRKLIPIVEKRIKEAIAFAAYPHTPNKSSHSCRNRDCIALKSLYPESEMAGSIFELKGLDKEKFQQLLEDEILFIADLPNDFSFSFQQRRQIELTKRVKPLVDESALAFWLEQLKYPIYFLDYEAISPNIPIYKGSQPYQHIVFQFSLHVIEKELAEPKHFEYLPDNKHTPTQDILKILSNSIKDDDGTVLVWHDSFEKARNKEMASSFPEFSKFLKSLNDRIVDMERVFNPDHGCYHDPKFTGKSSLKTILPVICPDFYFHSDLDISDGMMASILWYNFLSSSDSEPSALLRTQLLEYCKLDTLAMVKILEFLIRRKKYNHTLPQE
jgi:hypothetical protein